MSTAPPPTPMTDDRDPNKRIDFAFQEAARLSGTDIEPTLFFTEFLRLVLEGIDAPAGAVWLRNKQGFLQLQCQTNIENVGLDKHKNGRQSHNELLRQAFQTSKPILLEPFGSTGILEGIPAGNPTDFVDLLAPIMVDEKTSLGLVEVWQEARYDVKTKRTHLNFLVQMAGYASTFMQNQQTRQTVNLEQFWTQLEAFSRQVHSTLDATTASYSVANEGRRLIGCDRVCVAIRDGKSAEVEAVSGADVVEKRATQIRLMRKLFEAVINWGEKLIYRGTMEEGLPPEVHDALDKYLAESNAQLLVVQPLRDPREIDKETKEFKPGKARSALMMECFELPSQPEPLIARLDVIGRHAVSALYNAFEMRNIPLAWLWKPVLWVQEGLGGRARFLTALGIGAAILIIAAMVLVPYELKMEAKGQLLPELRRTVYAPHTGVITEFYVEPNQDNLNSNSILMKLRSDELGLKYRDLKNKIQEADRQVLSLESQIPKLLNNPVERDRVIQERNTQQGIVRQLTMEITKMTEQYGLDTSSSDGIFYVRAPVFASGQKRSESPRWKILTGSNFKSERLNSEVKPSDPILRIGEINGPLELEIKIPQRNMGHVRDAFKTDSPTEEIDVDFKLLQDKTKTYRGKLMRKKIGSEAVPNKDDHNETETVVLAFVRIEGDDIPSDMQMPRDKLLSGVEASVKIRCGKHPMGYSLFYGVWEFLHEKAFNHF